VKWGKKSEWAPSAWQASARVWANRYRAARYALAIIAGLITIACAATILAVAIATGYLSMPIGSIIVVIIVVRIFAGHGFTITGRDLLLGASLGLIVGTVCFGAGVVFGGQPPATLVFGATVSTAGMIGAAIGQRRREERHGGADRGQ